MAILSGKSGVDVDAGDFVAEGTVAFETREALTFIPSPNLMTILFDQKMNTDSGS